jgi:sensor histidine kinase YesM
MSFVPNINGALDTAQNFDNLEQRILKLEEKNQQLEERVKVLELYSRDIQLNPDNMEPSKDFSKEDVLGDDSHFVR